MEIKHTNKFNIGDSVRILADRASKDEKEYESVWLEHYNNQCGIITRILADINNTSIVYVVTIEYPNNRKEAIFVPEIALLLSSDKSYKDEVHSSPNTDTPPQIEAGDRIGIIPIRTSEIDPQKHIEELKVVSIEYSTETNSFTYIVKDEDGKAKAVPEKPTEDTRVEHMSSIYELLDKLRENSPYSIEVGKKAITHDYEHYALPNSNMGKVIKVETFYTQNGEQFVSYTESDGTKASSRLSEVSQLIKNAPKFEEGQTVCVRKSYKHSHDKYKIVAIYEPNLDGHYIARLANCYTSKPSPDVTAIPENDLMLAPKTAYVRKKKGSK